MEQLIKMDIISQIRLARLEDRLKEVLTPEQYEYVFSHALNDISDDEFNDCADKHGYSKLLEELKQQVN